MRVGMFFQPAFPAEPAVPLHEVIEQCLTTVEALDQLGYDEAWFGEHLTDAWEPWPAHDLVLASALGRTTDIKLCSGGYVLPYYHPAALAFRIMQLDHMAQGRYVAGLAAGISPVDLGLLGLDAAAGTHREMFAEAVDILIKLWTEHVGHEWDYQGTFWHVTNGAPQPPLGSPHLRPFQRPHPPVAISAVSPGSSTARLAGTRGFRLNSILLGDEHLHTHWDAYLDGAEKFPSVTPSREDWTIVRDVFVAETDAEARDWALRSSAATFWGKTLHLAGQAGWTKYLLRSTDPEDTVVDYPWLVDNHFLVGSPDTVLEKAQRMYDTTGGFGGLLMSKYDARDPRDVAAERTSLELFKQEVAPRLPS